MRSAGALWRRLPEGAVVLSPPGEPLVLNESAALVWDELATPCTLADLVSHLAARTGTDAAVIRTDVAPLVTRLHELGMLRRLDGAPDRPNHGHDPSSGHA